MLSLQGEKKKLNEWEDTTCKTELTTDVNGSVAFLLFAPLHINKHTRTHTQIQERTEVRQLCLVHPTTGEMCLVIVYASATYTIFFCSTLL